MSTFLTAWQFDLVALANLVLAGVAYGLGLRRVPAGWPVWRAVTFFVGLVFLASVYLGPIAAWNHTFFWAHMTQHLVVTMLAAPLLVLGAPITLAFAASGPRNRRALVRVLRSRAVRWLTDPLLTWVLFATVIIGAHFTGFYDWALTNHGAMVVVEQPMFLVAAVLYYLPVLGGNLLPNPPRPAIRLLSLATMMIPEAIVGAAIYFSPVVLYDGYETTRGFGLTAMQDQQLAGAMMWALVMVVDSFWMMWVAAEWWNDEERRSRQTDFLSEGVA